MAATLTADQPDLTYFSFPIEKAEEDPATGTVYVYGKATSPDVDTDEQIVDPEWSAKSIATWFQTGPNVRVMHNSSAMPAGSGVQVEIDRDGDGSHWVKAAVDEPTAKLMVLRKHLRAFSVGIAKPLIVRDVTGKARGGIIKGGELAEISLVDRPANRSCYVEIAKAAANGACEFTGKVFGGDDFLTKAAIIDDAPVTVDVPKSATITFSPGDLHKLLEHRRVAEQRLAEELPAFKAVANAEAKVLGKKSRNFSAERRRELAGQSNALPDGSYPIPDKDALRRAAILARSGHGDVAAARKLIARRARELGVNNPLDDDKPADGADKAAEAMPDVTPAAPEVAKDDGGDAHEAVLHHDDGEDDDTDSDADAMDKAAKAAAARDTLLAEYGFMPSQVEAMTPAALDAVLGALKAAPATEAAKAAAPAMPGKKVPCPKCKAMCKPKSKFCGKCGCAMGSAEKASKPTPDGGAVGAAEAAMQPAPEHREPDGPAIEALEHDAHVPTVPDAAVKTAARMAELGVPRQEGMLHDLLCPAYPAASVKAAWPGADLSLTDEMGWQAKAFEAATASPLGEVQQATEKASQAWTAARILKSVPAELYDEIMDEAHKAFRDANPGPATAPQPGEMHAQRYNRPYITAGHSAPSPDHDGPNRSPIHPDHISAADFSRGLITAGHAADSPSNDPGHPEPVPAPAIPGVPSRVFYTNVQRQNAQQAMRQMHDHIAMTFPDLCPMHGPGRMGEPPSHARPVAAGVGGPVPHGASKAADADEAVTDEATARAARKAAKRERKHRELVEAIVKQVRDGLPSLEEVRRDFPGDATAVKAAVPVAPVAPAVAATLDPDLIKSVVAAELKPVMKMLDAIASQPDPAVTAYRGAAIAKASAAPAGPLTVPQRAEHAQDAAYRAMYDQWRNNPDPDLRERAHSYLMGASGLIPRPPS